MTKNSEPETGPRIDPKAIVSSSAKIAEDATIGAFAIIGENAEIGPGCRVEAHAVIGDNTRLGRGNHVHHYAIIGTESQDAKFQGEFTRLEIGDNNIFREFVTVNRATGAGKATRIGSNCRLLAHAHVAHNCALEDGVILANCAELAGEVVVEENAIIGGLVGIHQFCRVGRHAIVGACSKVTQDIPPYMTADGHPARPRGVNVIGMRRHRFPNESIDAVKQAYRILFLRGLLLREALEALKSEFPQSPEVGHLVRFIESTSRAVARPRGPASDEGE
jgi:UDP-N-acetylglucosamine acyltransferase